MEIYQRQIKNICFKDLKQVKEWLAFFVTEMEAETIKSIVSSHHYLNVFYAK